MSWNTYDERVLQDWLEAGVHAAEAATWDGIASQLPSWTDGNSRAYHP